MRKKNVKLWNNLTKQLKDFDIRAGWFENSRYDDNTPIAGVAYWQNRGFKTKEIEVTDKMRGYLGLMGIHLKKTTTSIGPIVVPARPFMDNARARVEGQEGKKKLLQEFLLVFEGKQTMEQAAKHLGLWCQRVIQEEIKKIKYPALSSMTIEMRNKKYISKSKNKSTKPLEATRIMFDSVQSKVKMR